MSSNDIGLIIWGCKGGHRVFCSNNVVDYKNPTIADTIKDIRSFVRFNKINLTAYALEFTDQHKIYTIYRSCNDNGTGAYVAIIMYVPHSLKVNNIRQLLDRMMDDYFKEYVHPVFGTYIPGKYDDIEPFNKLLRQAEIAPEQGRFSHRASVQDDRPHLLIYNDVSEVDRYYDSPYRREFFDCQEVMFMSSALYGKKGEALRFNIDEQCITNVSEPEALPTIYLGDRSDVVSFKINGVEVDPKGRHQVNKSTDRISVTVRPPFCKDASFNGSVNTCIQNGFLKETGKVISIKYVPKDYIIYTLRISMSGMQCPEDTVFLKNVSTGDEIKVTHSSAEISGQFINDRWNIAIRPDRSAFGTLPCGNFCPADYIKANSPLDIHVQKFEFRVNIEGRGVSDKELYIYVGNKDTIQLPLKSGNNQFFTLYLPQNIDTSRLSFDVQDPETEVKFDNGVVTLTKKILKYELSIPSAVQNQVQSWDFIISNTSKKDSSFLGSNKWGIKLSAEDDPTRANLRINNENYWYEVRDNKIIPKMLCIIPDNNMGDCQYWARSGKVKHAYGICFEPYHNRPEEIRFPEGYNISADNSRQPVVIFNISENAQVRQQHTGNGPEPEPETNIIFRGFNDKGLNIVVRGKPYPISDNMQANFKPQDSYVICNSKGKDVGVIYKERHRYSYEDEKQNAKHGITVSYHQNNVIVTYEKPGFSFASLFENKVAIIASLLGVLVIALAAVAAWLFFSGNKAKTYPVLEAVFDLKYEDGTLAPVKISEVKGLDVFEDVKYDIKDTGNGHQLVITISSDLKKSNISQILGVPITIAFCEDNSCWRQIIYLDKYDDIKEYFRSLDKKDIEDGKKEMRSEQITIDKRKKDQSEMQDHHNEGSDDDDDESENQQEEDQKGKQDEVTQNESTPTAPSAPAADYNQILKKARDYKAALQSATSNPTTLAQAQNWWNNLPKDVQNKVCQEKDIKYFFVHAYKFYNSYFNARTLTEIQALSTSDAFNTLGAPQKAVVNFYLKNKDDFNAYFSECGMSYAKLKKNGYI